MNRSTLPSKFKKLALVSVVALSSFGINAQTNVYDDVIATSPNHTLLTAAISFAGLEGALQDPSATLTVFAPTDAAFNELAAELGTTIPGLLALPNISDILLYHVLGVTVPSSAVNNGAIVSPLSPTNTLKLTKTSMGSVYVNHAMVNAPDLQATNGVVHSIDAVVLPNETVVDIALDNGFTSLATAVATAELLPALTDPFATYTVFAPSNDAFSDLATALGTDINGLLALPDLADILLYHVLGVSVAAIDVNNGDRPMPLNMDNTIKLTKTSMGAVYANHAKVEIADLVAGNGIVHTLDAVILPAETVVDVAIDNNFTTLMAAVEKAELVPALSNPLGEFTVFAPTNASFDALATALNTDLNGILALPNLADVLLYHVVGGTVLSTDLANGNVTTLNGDDVIVNLTAGVKINNATVTLADVLADNGVVHVIDAVLVPGTASIDDIDQTSIALFPNPSVDVVTISSELNMSDISIVDQNGKVVYTSAINSNAATIDVSNLLQGHYIVNIASGNKTTAKNLLITSK